MMTDRDWIRANPDRLYRLRESEPGENVYQRRDFSDPNLRPATVISISASRRSWGIQNILVFGPLVDTDEAAAKAIKEYDRVLMPRLSAIDPESPSNTMCLNLEAVQDAKDALVDVYKSTCKRKLDNGEFAVCPFFDVCGYERQRQTEADLWIVPHDLLFLEKPNAIGKLAFLVVDESVWQDGLEGVHGKPTALSLDAVGHLEKPSLDASIVHRQQLERLEFLRNRLVDVLREQADGALLAEPIEASELTVENTREAYKLEWSRFVDPGMHPAMSKAQRREAVQQAAINATIPRLGRMWQSMTALLEDGGPSRSGWVAVATQPTDDGQVRVLHLKGRRPIRKGWLVPTLLIDATMNVDLVRPYWPGVELTAELLADAPHQRVRQVVDRAYSKSAIEPLTPDMSGYSPEEAKRRNRGLRAVHAVLNREARQHDAAPALVVVQKAVKEALPEFGPMATNIDLAHHNAVAGRDQWRAVRQLIVVGRTQPAPASVERLAEALTGAAVTPLGRRDLYSRWSVQRTQARTSWSCEGVHTGSLEETGRGRVPGGGVGGGHRGEPG